MIDRSQFSLEGGSLTATTIGVRHTVVPPSTLTDRYARALTFSSAIHAARQHEHPEDAAMAHLLGASSLVLQCGGEEELAIAALLHDAVEHCGGLSRVADIRARFGERIAGVVLGCSRVADDESHAGSDFHQHSQARLQQLAASHPDTLLVCLAVATERARTMATDLQAGLVRGPLHETPTQLANYYEECLRIGRRRGMPTRLTSALALAVDALLATGAESLEIG